MKTKATVGDYNFICDQCGFKYKASHGQWTYINGHKHLYTCMKCWDRDHPGNRVLPTVPGEGRANPVIRAGDNDNPTFTSSDEDDL